MDKSVDLARIINTYFTMTDEEYVKEHMDEWVNLTYLNVITKEHGLCYDSGELLKDMTKLNWTNKMRAFA